MRKNRYTVLCLSVCVMVAACSFERIVEIDPLDIKPHWVLNSLLQTDRDSSFFYLTESRSVYIPDSIRYAGVLKGFQPIKDATMQVSINGNVEELLYSHQDTAYVLGKRLHANDDVKVVVNHTDKRLEARTVLPWMPEVLSVDTSTVYKLNEGYSERYLMFKVKIKDRPGERNYYRLLVDGFFTTDAGLINPYGYYTYSPYDTEDLVLLDGTMGGGYNNDLGLAFSPVNLFSVFRDRSFEGEEYTLKFYVKRLDLMGSFYKPIQYHLHVGLQSVSEELYKYFSTLQASMYANWDDISEPVVVYSNINGGLGILGSSNEVKLFRHTEEIEN